MASLHVARLAAISSYLLPVAAPRKIPHAHGGPTQFRHDPRQSSKGGGGPVALGDLKKI